MARVGTVRRHSYNGTGVLWFLGTQEAGGATEVKPKRFKVTLESLNEYAALTAGESLGRSSMPL